MDVDEVSLNLSAFRLRKTTSSKMKTKKSVGWWNESWKTRKWKKTESTFDKMCSRNGRHSFLWWEICSKKSQRFETEKNERKEKQTRGCSLAKKRAFLVVCAENEVVFPKSMANERTELTCNIKRGIEKKKANRTSQQKRQSRKNEKKNEKETWQGRRVQRRWRCGNRTSVLPFPCQQKAKRRNRTAPRK